MVFIITLINVYSIIVSTDFISSALLGLSDKNKIIKSNLMKLILTHVQLFQILFKYKVDPPSYFNS